MSRHADQNPMNYMKYHEDTVKAYILLNEIRGLVNELISSFFVMDLLRFCCFIFSKIETDLLCYKRGK